MLPRHGKPEILAYIIPSFMDRRAKTLAAFVLFLAAARVASARAPGGLPSSVPLQPFADEVRQLESALSFLGQPLSSADRESINAAFANPAPEKAISA